MFLKFFRKDRKKNHKKDESLLQQIGQGIEEGVKNISQGIEDGVKNIETGVKNLGQGIETGVKNISQGIETGVKNIGQEIEDKLEEIGQEINREVKIVTKKIKKKIDLFYKITFFLLLTLSVVLAYFVILVSTTPKSFPFVTNEIRKHLKQEYGDMVVFDDAYISFTSYGTLKVSVKNLKIFDQNSNLQTAETQQTQDPQEFLLPNIEAEFSLLNLLHSSFSPRKLKISNSEITLNDFSSSAENPEDSSQQISKIVGALTQLKKEKLLTKSFEIENAKLIIKTPTGAKEILIKKSQIRTVSKDNILYASSTNQISFSPTKKDVNLNTSCQMAQYDVVKCDVFLVNVATDSIADLHPSLNILNQIDTTINSGISFVIDSGKFNNVNFKTQANAGSFLFPEFFGERMFFSDFALKGEYNDALGMLNVSEIKADFKMHNDADLANPKSLTLKTNLNMSLIISDLKEPNHRFDFYIGLKNAPTNELEKLWPVFLHDHGIREWVITHITDGTIHDASTRFSLIQKPQEMALENLNAEVVFAGLNLKYSDSFPQINNVNGSAKFSQKGMNIALNSGDVLGSKIYDSRVTIDDFNAATTMLKISGKSKGNAADSLKHADNSPKFTSEIEKYLNGNSQNSFDIKIPLSDNLSLKKAYISVNSQMDNLQNEYVKGAIIAAVKKDFGSEDFAIALNLNNAELAIKSLNIEKKMGADGGLNLAIGFPTVQTIALKNISLWKKEYVAVNKKAQAIDAKITGNIRAETSPFLVTAADIKNENFGRNSYTISYTTDKKSSMQKLLIRGQVMDLAPMIQNNFAGFSGGDKTYNNMMVQVALDNLLLANSKSIKTFSLGLKCADQLCYSGGAIGSYNKRGQSLTIRVNKKPEDKFSTIEGQITDVGYLAEALGISKIISGGNARVKLQNKIVDKKLVLEGEVDLEDSITIYENPTVKRLASNSLFSKVRDKIFSEDKTIFDSLKLKFSLKDGVLDIQSLIANNYKIGITAKGTMDLKNDVCQIKGMIVPGFIVNNLFGIGNIPILGNVVGLLTGGEGGGLFGIRYEYTKNKGDKEAKFETSKVSSFVPTTIKNLFDLI